MNGNDDIRIEISPPQRPPQPPPSKHVDACTFSPDGNHLATYSATEGIITIWNVATLEKKEKTYDWQNNGTVLKPREYRVEKISFDSSKSSKQMMSDVDFALSNKGKADYILSPKNKSSRANIETNNVLQVAL